MTTATALPLRVARGSTPPPAVGTLTFRDATPDDAGAIHALICAHQDEGRLLPRQLGEIEVHARRFVVAGDDEQIVACADLAPLSRTLAEVRSLVVTDASRSCGVGRQLVDALIARASNAGFERLCAFTHSPRYFVQLGFSIVPHEWLSEKIHLDCGTCARFQRCGQYAVMLPLTRTRHSRSLGSLHG